jgi:hypothetical protein
MRPALIIAMTTLLLLLPLSGRAVQPLFDSHLHYNEADARAYSPAQIIAILDRYQIQRAVVTGTPAHHALDLYRQAPERILPFLGVYRSSADKGGWSQDTALPDRVQQALAQGRWRGVGELHIFAQQRHSPVFLRIVDLSTAQGLPLLMHCDPAVIDSLFEHRPDATVIWAHAGAYPYPALLADYLQRYPRLYVDLSVRDERIAPGGVLDGEWEILLMEHASRFLIGVDTYRTERWGEYGAATALIRGWLTQLPASVALQLAHDNAARLFDIDHDAHAR